MEFMNQQDRQVTYIESLKFPTTPGLSPGVGLRKQGLLALQMIPCTQGRVPAEGKALLGKWPGNICINIGISISKTEGRLLKCTYIIRPHWRILITLALVILVNQLNASILRALPH